MINTKGSKKKERKINPKKYHRLIRKERWGDFKALIFFLIFTFFLAGVIATYNFTIPIYKETRESMFETLSQMNENTFMRAGNTDIYDVNGNLMGRLGNEKYDYVDISDISKYVTYGYIAKEDRNFSMHNGVDLKGTFRAMLTLVKNRGSITQGGSTITQQVIKNNMLTQERTYKRKIIEIFLAWQLEREYNKAQIMEFYCNSNYYGNGCYGIEGASQYYFGCHASELSLGKAAMLVATSNSPNSYNPVIDYEKSMEEKERVLKDMLECKYISQEEFDKAVAEEPEIVKKSQNVSNENYMITYAIHCAALKVMKANGFTFKYTFESSDEYKKYAKQYDEAYNKTVAEIREGGYTIHTSLNPEIQKKLQKSIDEGMKEYDEKQDNGIYSLQGAGVCVDNKTGLVVAIAGGREGKGSYNRGYQSKRQSGSSIKPLIDYAPAYNEGIYTPASILVDEEVDIDGYKPKNAWKGYKGNISSREALLRSYNTIAVKTYMKVTKTVALSYMDKMKFGSLTYSDMVAPSLAVGGFTVGVTVEDMAKGYATLAMNGQYVDNDCILSLTSYTGKEVYKHKEGNKHEVFNEDVAFMINDILSGMFIEDYMPGTKFKKSNQVYMGKTGTTNDNKDAWFCGSSPYYSTALWIGYDTPKEMEGIAGGTKPCEIWTDFMDTLHGDLKLERKEFPVPKTVMLSNGSGQTKEVGYSKDVYKSRPEGWDYVSMILKEKREQKIREEEEHQYEEDVKLAVSEFEEFQITNVQEAQEVDELYNELFEMVDAIKNKELREELLERIAYKYQLLTGDLTEKWNAAIEAHEKEMQAQLDSDNEIAAELSEEQAKEAERNSKIGLVECYINLLNIQTVYSDIFETWIVKADYGLKECEDYGDDYQRLAELLDEAVLHIRNLQEEYLKNKDKPNADEEEYEDTDNQDEEEDNNNHDSNDGTNDSNNGNDDSYDNRNGYGEEEEE